MYNKIVSVIKWVWYFRWNYSESVVVGCLDVECVSMGDLHKTIKVHYWRTTPPQQPCRNKRVAQTWRNGRPPQLLHDNSKSTQNNDNDNDIDSSNRSPSGSMFFAFICMRVSIRMCFNAFHTSIMLEQCTQVISHKYRVRALLCAAIESPFAAMLVWAGNLRSQYGADGCRKRHSLVEFFCQPLCRILRTIIAIVKENNP